MLVDWFCCCSELEGEAAAPGAVSYKGCSQVSFRGGLGLSFACTLCLGQCSQGHSWWAASLWQFFMTLECKPLTVRARRWGWGLWGGDLWLADAKAGAWMAKTFGRQSFCKNGKQVEAALTTTGLETGKITLENYLTVFPKIEPAFSSRLLIIQPYF